jgi:hypothetical protein
MGLLAIVAWLRADPWDLPRRVCGGIRVPWRAGMKRSPAYSYVRRSQT